MLNFFFFARTLIRLFQYLLSPTKRYAYLLLLILKFRPKTIMEIGVYTGKRSKDMILASRIFNKKISYYGFDLFEDFYKNKNILKNELSKKPLTKKDINDRLKKIANIKLFKGYTYKTLKKFSQNKIKIDFIFIDGGHSIQTIKNDWFYVSKLLHKDSVVVFDDFYLTKRNITNKFGCNFIIKELSKNYCYDILPLGDLIKIFNKKTIVKFLLVRSKKIF